jgi:hypothetical protein
VKSKQEHGRRAEFEYEIPRDHVEEMLAHHCGTNTLEKTRHSVPFEGRTWEVDVYAGLLEGVILAEVELDVIDQAVALPEWAGEEVTHRPEFKKIEMLKAQQAGVDDIGQHAPQGAQSGLPSRSTNDRKIDNSARKLLSFDWTSTRKRASVVAKGAAMDAKILASALMMQLVLMRERLDQAAGLGQAAEACAKSGNVGKAIEIALDIEQLTYEVNTLLNAASLMNRICRP